ncbi:MAG: Uma2 family endonuclease [Methylomonas sp.]|nr:Uma2 family endonuclease [Methylomonas sp.]PPD19298.1 MAG: hypothetical protein CTY23_12145 [Methylomonas sp.]PPD23852.1 MAG: hypothetical protein CTY22_11735 [Methylomonas sp.]PPD31796.1 MAG: hypothetical protein CTY21_11740 [Methylomonas sp.]PPD37636.1 MAG: hypothetical protein CTY17_10710 [Methylomonas sp.]
MVAVFPQKHLTDLAEWHRMGEAGIFPPDAHLELIEGEILTMAPIGFNHAGHVHRLNRIFARLWDKGLDTRIQSPIQLGDLSEPEPDLALVKADANDYTTRHPITSDVLLLAEVSDSTLRFDKTTKLRLYASHGIPEYWVVNLIDNCLEVYRQPQQSGYLQQTIYQSGDCLSLLALPDIQIVVKDIL